MRLTVVFPEPSMPSNVTNPVITARATGMRALSSSSTARDSATAQRFYRVHRLRGGRAAARGARTISWKLRPDVRKASNGPDREAQCRKCQRRIVILPDDRRQGYCFDCYDSLEIRAKTAF